ncbi:MAG: hypothetical protein ACRDHW_22345, partial [Ktedonobacteraceae bacterium]
ATETPLLPQDNPWLTTNEEETGTKPPLLSRLWQSHVSPQDHTTTRGSLGTSTLSPDEGEIGAGSPDQRSPQLDASILSPIRQPSSSGANRLSSSAQNSGPGLLSAGATVSGEAQPSPIEAALPVQREMPGELGRLPALRVIGQFAQSFIVTEGQDGLYLVDQHAAHERILLEHMVAALQARASLSQLLLTPMQLDLAPAELGAIEEHREHLEHIGFDLEIEDIGVIVRAVPQVLVKQMNARSLQELLAELTAPESLGHAETWEEHALANVACKAAIKANYFLTSSEMREMLTQLAQTKAPYSCCHGRPTTVHFSLNALEREFGRR